MPSAIAQVPIPETADGVSGDGRLDDVRISYRGRWYDLGLNVTPRQVRAWIAERGIVENGDWRRWRWCLTIEGSGGGSQYIWRKEGTDRILSVTFDRNTDDMASFSNMYGHSELLVATYRDNSTEHANPGCD